MHATRREILRYICHKIEHLYPVQERISIARMIAPELEGVSFTKYMIEPDEVTTIEGLEEKVEELAQGRPVQYVLGAAEFCDLKFRVREGVLIPRPETEELVVWAEKCAEQFTRPRILDMCTGSGCIAITLANHVAGSSVVGIDLSEEALAIAQENNDLIGTDVEFVKADVLGDVPQLSGREFDIIVSNPPYIPLSERADMRCNVTDYEPAMALFVEDDNPLKFYRAIADKAKTCLADNGFLLFEIHENLAEESAGMLREEGFIGIEIRRDFLDKPRMICCQPKRE